MSRLTNLIIIALVAGIAVGYAGHQYLLDPAANAELSNYLSLPTTIFLRLIQAIIAPLIFTSLVAGLAGINDAHTLGRIGGRTLGWFVGASFCSLLLGLVGANLLHPGTGIDITLPEIGAVSNLNAAPPKLTEFVAHIFPRNLFEALASNQILQILVFATLFGIALGHFRSASAQALVQLNEGIAQVMMRVTGYVMKLAPLAVFGAVAAAIVHNGLNILLVYGKLLGAFFLTLAALWVVLLGACYVVLGRRAIELFRVIRPSLLLGFTTATSESVYPKLMEQLEQFGADRRITSLVMPLGYSFNLDGSMIFTTFAALFIAQAYQIHMPLSTQFVMLLVLMVSSKGIAGVPRASLVVIAAVLPMFGLPQAGLLLIIGVDQFLDMGRTATNVLGIAIATAVVDKWEKDLRPRTQTLAQDRSDHGGQL